ncbi:MAG: hypothetical protein F9K22_14945, partial [Bacteroidetes bacterium]
MTWFTNRSIGTKLGMGFGLLLFLTASIGFLGYSGMTTMNDNQEELYTDGLIMVADYGEINGNVLTLRGNLLAALSAPSDDIRRKYLATLNGLVEMTDKIISQTDVSNMADDERRHYENTKTNWTEYRSIVQKAAGFIESGNKAGAVQTMYVEGIRSVTDLRKALEDMVAFNRTYAGEFYRASSAVADRDILWIEVILLTAMVFGAGIAYFITRSITVPVAAVVANIR